MAKPEVDKQAGRPNVVQHLVVIHEPAQPHPDLEGVGVEIKGGAVKPAKVTAGRQQFACHEESQADQCEHAGRLWEGALHQGTDDPQFVTCPYCKDTQEFKDGIAAHDRATAKDRGLFSRAGLSQRASRFVRPQGNVGGDSEPDAGPADRADGPVRGAGQAAGGSAARAAGDDGDGPGDLRRPESPDRAVQDAG